MPTNFPASNDINFGVPSDMSATPLNSPGDSARTHGAHHLDLGDAVMALEANVALTTHTHSGTGTRSTPKLVQANTHQTADTDTAATAIHHTLGTSAFQSAAGNHLHRATNFALTGGGTWVIDASLGDQVITATSNITIGVPTNPSDGQRLFIEVFANTNITVGLVAGISNATNRALPLSLLVNTVAIIGLYYSSRAGHWIATGVPVEPQ
jgi:hypothetical protein